MPNIDTLSIQFNTNGTETAIKNIKSMGYAVRNLAQSVKSIDANKLSAFTASMETLKKSVPTEAQTSRMVAFGEAVKSLSSAIGTANISDFSKSMATMGGAVDSFKKSSVNSIKNAVTAMSELQTQAQTTANVISNAIPQKSTPISRGDNKSTVSQTREMVASLDKAGSRVDAINSKFRGIFVPTKQFKNLEDQADKIAKKYDELRSRMQEALNAGKMSTGDSKFKQQSAELDALRNQYNDLILKQRELAISGQGIELNPRVLQSLNAFRNGFTSVINLVRNGFVAGIRAANSHLRSFASRVKETAIAAKNAITSGHRATDMAKKFANEITRVGKMLKLMITRMVLRKIIAEVSNGFKSLAIHSQEFNQSVSSMMNGAKKLSYSFAAMVSPLLNALAPAIVYVINLLVRLANAIQQVFAVFTGATSWNRAKDFTEDWASNLQDANKNAKELKKTVLGFDELNQLQEKSSSGSGSGNDIADMFETVNIDPKWKEFADWLKKMWEIGDFSKLGKKLGTQLRDLLESIPWDKIRATSHKLGESLATLINGFVEVERLGYDIGTTIAQSVNTVFEFINGFVHRLHWDSIGKFIADTFNGFFEKIDWVLIKDTVVTGLAGIGQAIQNFIDNFHWDNISNFIINGIDTISSGIKAFFEEIDWLDLGKKVGDQIAKSIRGTDWVQVGEAIGDVIRAGIDYVAGILETMPSVDELVSAASDVLTGMFDKVDFYELGSTIGTILRTIYDFITGFWDENGDAIKDKVKDFFRGIWDNIDKGDLAKVLAGVLGAAALVGIANMGWSVLTTYLSARLTAMLTSQAISTAIGGGVTTAATSTTVTAAAGAAGLTIGATILGGIVEFLSAHALTNEIMQYLKPDDAELYAEYSGLFGVFKELKDVAVGAWDLVNMAWEDATRQHVAPLTEEQKQKLDELRQKAAEASSDYEKGAQGIVKANDEIKESLKNTGLDENSLLYQKLYEDMKATTEQSQKVVAETKNVSTAYKGSTDAVEGLKKMTAESTKATSDFVAKHKESDEGWRKLKESIGQTTKTTEESKKVLGDLTKTTADTTKGVKELSDTMSKDFGASENEFISAAKEMEAEITKNFEGIHESSKGVSEEIPKELSDAINTIMNSENDLSDNTSTTMDDILKTVGDGTKDITTDLDTIKDGMTKDEWTFDGVVEGFRLTFKRAREAIKTEWNSIANTLNGEHEIGAEKMKINLPKFATGGFPEDGLFMANHHELVGSFSNGKTAVANNGQIIAGIETGVYSAMSKVMSQTSGSSQYIANEIIVDGDVIARTVSKAQDRQNRRFSPATT